jgi:mono/diheme cytochrome c family protein
MRALLLFGFVFAAQAAAALPEDLRDTGLEAPGLIAFEPQYPLWSDGTDKRRWLYLPPGTAIDAARTEAWDFPVGTKAWKEFSHGGQRIETRYLERLADGSWRYATYVWNAQGTQALLAPAQGAPGRLYPIPSRADCLACHEGTATPVLGFSALQLARDLPRLSSLQILRNLPAEIPRIDAPSEAARAALGYLHGNCGHCHNDQGPLANVGLVLAQPAAGAGPTDPRPLLSRLQSRNPLMRMPPLGVTQPDAAGIALVARWLQHDLQAHLETPR